MPNLTFPACLCLGGLKETHNGHLDSFNERTGGQEDEPNSQIVFAFI